MNKRLRNSIAALMTGSALAAASTGANAIDVTDLGTLPTPSAAVPSPALSTDSTVPQYAWDGYNNYPTPLLGWAHTTKWYTFKLAKTTTVQITMTSGEVGMNPAFTLWQTSGSFIGGNHLGHAYNQVVLSGASNFLKPQPPQTDGVTAFWGFVNSGPTFTNGDGQYAGKGLSGLTRTDTGYAAFARTLPKGQYLIAAGGSCKTANCGTPAQKAFNLNVQPVPFLDSGILP